MSGGHWSINDAAAAFAISFLFAIFVIWPVMFGIILLAGKALKRARNHGKRSNHP